MASSLRRTQVQRVLRGLGEAYGLAIPSRLGLRGAVLTEEEEAGSDAATGQGRRGGKAGSQL
jgi:hypothetical protein